MELEIVPKGYGTTEPIASNVQTVPTLQMEPTTAKTAP